MQRVAVLSHVKASSVPPSLTTSSARRIAWHGGKISSNKVEALQKFYQRKLRTGDQLTAQQIETMQATLHVELDKKRVHTNSKKGLATHRSHAKVTADGHHMVLKTGRVLGPKIDKLKPKIKKTRRKNTVKHQTVPQLKTTGKMSSKQVEKDSFISLEDKLGLPLHALVGKKVKRSSRTKQG
ncbi:unnamed protein product [Peronospora belbahrii]|uniref:Uncharacterized protein n=1 Tax=Peronospora belbahrii TaxID=622444 RepID=A0AAU9LBL0_9STRA|nr:unnamed protein product [Peronospora belbahrii]CAH0517262.1 unnamed protein product [Peronospora belbahrii]